MYSSFSNLTFKFISHLTVMAGQAKSLAEIEADLKKTTLNQSPAGGNSPSHSRSGPASIPSNMAHPAVGVGGGVLSHQMLFGAGGQQGRAGSPPKGDQSAFNSFIASMKAGGGLGGPEVRSRSLVLQVDILIERTL